MSTESLAHRILNLGAYSYSDIHLAGGEPIALRVDGKITRVGDAITHAEFDGLLAGILTKVQQKAFIATGEIDLALALGGNDYRLSLYRSRSRTAACLRRIAKTLPTLASLGLPEGALKQLSKNSGLILVAGATGSGKSTTLAVLLDHLNQDQQGHILTIEDPIEFVHQPQRCIVSQREIGKDSSTFASALRAGLRQDPNYILIGELRDAETIELALQAAETGHLVFATLHAPTVDGAVSRILDGVSKARAPMVCAQLSRVLLMVIGQRLVLVEGGGRRLALNVMLATHAVRNVIREGRLHQLATAIQTGGGMAGSTDS